MTKNTKFVRQAKVLAKNQQEVTKSAPHFQTMASTRILINTIAHFASTSFVFSIRRMVNRARKIQRAPSVKDIVARKMCSLMTSPLISSLL